MSKEQEIILNSPHELESQLQHIRDLWAEKKYLRITVKTGRQRSGKQNRALHMWLDWVAAALNAAGWDMKRTLSQEADIPWTMESAKEHLWRPVQEAMFNKESTTEADRDEFPQVSETLVRHLASKTGVQMPPWPNQQDRK